MSWGTCYSGSNNIHFDYPPIMMDGRNFADWQPGAVINERIRQDAHIKSNADYSNHKRIKILLIYINRVMIIACLLDMKQVI